MLSFNNFLELSIVLFTYLFIYNISLVIIFWTLQQFVINNFKTLYSFSDFKLNFFFLVSVTIVFFSIAGVPPFLGFFPKILIMVLLMNSNFFIFFIFFFALLFLGLYFYIQNIRFLHSTALTKTNYAHDFLLRSPISYFYWTTLILFFLVFGPLFLDDVICFFFWLFS